MITLVIRTRINSEFSFCPRCKCSSSKQHSYYIRQLSDVAWAGIPAIVNLKVRKFFCQRKDCPQKIFTERAKGLPSYARRTTRQRTQLQAIGLKTGANGGACLSQKIGIKVSSSTLLRLLHKVEIPFFETPRVLGVDDWAMRKGHTYGTILIDLEKHQPIDLLLDREAATLEQWLKNHPGVEILSRDRALAYAEGAKKGAPKAKQVADRWHLLKNLTEALRRMMDKYNKESQKVAIEIAEEQRGELLLTQEVEKTEIVNEIPIKKSPSKYELMFDEVKKYQVQGLSIRAICSQTGTSRETIAKYMKYESYPKRAERKNIPSKVAVFDDFIQQRWKDGLYNYTQLWREVSAKGYRGAQSTFRNYMAKYYPIEKSKTPKLAPLEIKVYSARRLSYLLGREVEDLKEKELVYLKLLFTYCPAARKARELALNFKHLMKNRAVNLLDEWMENAMESGTGVLKTFAQSLTRDLDAVKNAFSMEWSNGQVEGQVNRLKNIKRQMYGRAGFELLKKMVLADTG